MDLGAENHSNGHVCILYEGEDFIRHLQIVMRFSSFNINENFSAEDEGVLILKK